jgi:hypothetical protein
MTAQQSPVGMVGVGDLAGGVRVADNGAGQREG